MTGWLIGKGWRNTMKLCKIENCKYIHKAKGLCRKHYVMQRANRVPEPTKNVQQSKASKEMWRKIRELQR